MLCTGITLTIAFTSMIAAINVIAPHHGKLRYHSEGWHGCGELHNTCRDHNPAEKCRIAIDQQHFQV